MAKEVKGCQGRGRRSISSTSPLANVPASPIRLLPRLGSSLPFFGQINDPTLFQHVHWRACLAAEFPRSPRGAAKRRVHRQDIGVL